MGQLYFDICALVILIILAISIMTRRLYIGRSNRLFCIMISCIAVSTITDILAGLYGTVFGLTLSGIPARAFINYIYFITRNITPLIYVLYVLSYIGVWHIYVRDRKSFFLISAPCALSLLLIITNSFTHLIFYFDDSYVYRRGYGNALIYFIAVAYIIASCVMIVKYRRLLSGDRLLALVSQLPVSIATVILQYLFPGLLIEMFGSAVVVLIFSTILQRGEEILDPISGVQNYSASLDAVHRAFDTGYSFSIIYLGILNSEVLRTYLGMDRFNATLKEVGSRITKSCLNYKLRSDVYYLQNGIFAIITPDTEKETVATVSAAIVENLNKPFEVLNFRTELNCRSCMVRCPKDIDSYEGVVNFEGTLNRVLSDEKNSSVLSEVINSEDFRLKKDLNDVIADAVANKKFAMYYQPVYSAKKMKFVAAEALIRLTDERYGTLSPDVFIPAAQENGAIHQIGDYVMDEVCRFISECDITRMGLEHVEINLSAAQCVEADLVFKILSALDKYDLDTDRISFDITEKAADFDPTMVDRNIGRLHEKGIRFALDDYGTGYSDVGRVISLPADVIKLDKGFVDQMDDPKMWIVIRNTVNMLHEMKKEVLVEGVEDEKTLNRFLDLGCEYIQGYYFSKPLPEEEFVKFMLEKNGK